MKQKYFIYNGIKCNEGTVIILSRFDYISRKVCNVRAKFLYYNIKTEEYVVEIYGREYRYTKKNFYNDFVGVYKKTCQNIERCSVTNNKHTLADELNIDSLLLAWIWYVFIMVVGTIFYDRILIWGFASVIFFNYRNKKLKEAGYK